MSPVGELPEPLHTLHERLYQAAVNGEAQKISELFKLGAKMSADEEGRTPLHMACGNGFVDSARCLILNGGAKINQLDACGYTPLHHAAMDGHMEVIRLLAKHGCALNAQERLSGNTALHEAAWRGFSRTVEVLARAHANLYVKNKAGFTALHLAAQNGHNQSSRVLLMEGCGPDVKNNYGDTPLHTATRYGHAGVVRILVSAFCNVQETNRNGDTALHVAVAMRKRKLTKILLESGASVFVKNEQGESPLDLAQRKAYPEIEEMLLHSPAIVRPDNVVENGKGKKREKDPNTSTSSGKLNTSASRKKKKTKTKGDMLRSKSLPSTAPVGPYGCPHSPHDMAGFPTPKIETLPPDPLAKGEQYYLDLAGNIRKGPVGRGYSCYCVPFFKDFERKLEADKQELQEKIGESKQDLEKKIKTLERNTISQLQSLDIMRDPNENSQDEQSLQAFAERKIGRRTSPLGRSSPPLQTQHAESSSARWSKLMECRASLGLHLNESSGESSQEDDDDDDNDDVDCHADSGMQVRPMTVFQRIRPLSTSYMNLPTADFNEVGLPLPESVDLSRTLSRLERRSTASLGAREPAAGRSPSLLENNTPPPSAIASSLPEDTSGVRKPICRPPKPPSYQTHMERLSHTPVRSGTLIHPGYTTCLGQNPRSASTPPKVTPIPSHNVSSSCSSSNLMHHQRVSANHHHHHMALDSVPSGARSSMQNLTSYIPEEDGSNLFRNNDKLTKESSATKLPSLNHHPHSPRTQRLVMSSEV
ncbi:ankyrin repeat domain-containing protein 6 [Galendromus occidentalis]|uniref:Ankyrin repeat domain-containing protein 6 n=1 Tax=Galendromus occidentalis TaxID=34638 RepID=A0AAJ7WHN4_9ACAR|nr:ankyrin repeat domain-containing protein 6 [Galendromus occidentalis]